MTVGAMRAGADFVALSDMKNFFPYVPRARVVEILGREVGVPAFQDLFARAIETELENPDQVAEWLDLFPIGEVGVAQGCPGGQPRREPVQYFAQR